MAIYFRILQQFPKRLSSGKHLSSFSYSTSTQTLGFKEKVDHNDVRMSAWQIHSYGSLEELQFTKNARLPSLMSPNEVLVKVLAASVNPIDAMMLTGYGSSVLNTMRQFEQFSLIPEVEFPMILGRDCCGKVVAKGNNVGSELRVGDIVYGVVPVHQQGCHAQNVLLHKDLVRRTPDSLSIEEASSILFTGVTAWSALKLTGDLWVMSPNSKKVLVVGASGGVGTVAVQLLKAWGAEVVATCSADAVQLVRSLHADHVIDYTKPDARLEMASLGQYDIVLDAAGLPESEIPSYVSLLKDWALAKYITLRSPFLRNVDQYGLIPGMLRNATDIVLPNLSSGAIARSSSVRWGFFMPVPKAVDELDRLISEKKVKPVIQKVYKFSDLPQAYKDVQDGHLRGKIVVTVN